MLFMLRHFNGVQTSFSRTVTLSRYLGAQLRNTPSFILLLLLIPHYIDIRSDRYHE